jgi:hypothetical protein
MKVLKTIRFLKRYQDVEEALPRLVLNRCDDRKEAEERPALAG